MTENILNLPKSNEVESTAETDIESFEIPHYVDNLLIEACGPILSTVQIAARLTFLPKLPGADVNLPVHVKAHLALVIKRIHLPTKEGIEIARMIDVMMRQGYVHRKPTEASTWRRIYDRKDSDPSHIAVQIGASVGGLPGTGKTTAIEMALRLKDQVVVHQKFPGMASPVRQLLWIKIDVPSSGKVVDLAEALARATDAALGTKYADELLSGRSKRGITLANEWLAKVACHFVGLIVLDEVQNFFKLETKKERARNGQTRNAHPVLRIADDEALKFVLTLTNSTKIPILISGSPDGMRAFTTRMSTSQRFSTGGYHEIPHAVTADDHYFKTILFPHLAQYQWFPKTLPATDELRRHVHRLSGGISRIYMALWYHAQIHAFSRRAEVLELNDFDYAANHQLKLLREPVQALLSNSEARMAPYQDLYSGS